MSALAATTATLAAGALPSQTANAQPRALPTNPDVVVIGAGSAGIAAARRLIAEGLEVVVIEAADRIGGRAWTDSASLGQPFDRGASWLQGPADLPHLALAREQDLGLISHAGARDVFFVGDRRATATERRQRDRAWSAVNAALEAARGDVPAASVLPLDMPFAGSVATWIGPMDFAVDIDQLSTADWASYADYDVNYLVRDGLGTLVARMGEGLPVRLNTPARAIDWSGPGVRVETDAGTITARACVVTVSTGVLAAGGIRFTPDLPVTHQQAIADLPMGQLLKIGLMFDGARFGLSPGDFVSHAVAGPLPAEACYFLCFPAGLDYVVGFVGGSVGRALERAGQAAAIDFALERFAGMLGSGVRAHFRAGLMSGWDANPLTRGAYSAVRPGRFPARAALARPLGERVFFAGEAMATPFAALVSGAHLHGDDVAGRVAALLDAPGCTSCAARHRNRNPEATE
jgi:monoamine oxidase